MKKQYHTIVCENKHTRYVNMRNTEIHTSYWKFIIFNWYRHATVYSGEPMILNAEYPTYKLVTIRENFCMQEVSTVSYIAVSQFTIMIHYQCAARGMMSVKKFIYFRSSTIIKLSSQDHLDRIPPSPSSLLFTLSPFDHNLP
jgi:hypothetical protein